MVKTQVQFPDNLYDEAKRIAAENEMSFAEVVRRGLETMVRDYPAGRAAAKRWKLPAARRMGAPLIPEEEWDLASRDEA
jgi:hypothetical protein